MRPLDLILPKLDRVTGTNGQYSARCPSHEDSGPSLSIKEAEDGKVLVHCHAGCTADDITGAIGLTLNDLFPPSTLTKPQRRTHAKRQTQAEIEALLQHELLILLQVIGGRVDSRTLEKDTQYRILTPEYQPVPDGHWEREQLAAKRILNGLRMLYGKS